MPGNSFTRSISKRFSRRRRKRQESVDSAEPATVNSTAAATVSSPIGQINAADQQPTSNALANLAQPPSQQNKGIVGRSMDRLRRSIRQTIRRRDREQPPELVPGGSGNSRNEAWQPDEGAVRAGLCHFNYLGSVEVFESRGMAVCEGALKVLRAKTRRPVKAVLYVSGDGLRVVDQENNRGLIVDQTIEKVSFCAPDRNNDKGFAYICRDGTSRRWMCHGFHATKETGERLSHAVGCAFAVCLERKKKRDDETHAANSTAAAAAAQPLNVEKALNPNWDTPNGTVEVPPTLERTNQAYQSFRRVSINERKIDPQSAVLATPLAPPAPTATNHQANGGRPPAAIAKPRPAANPALFERQGSLRAPEPAATAAFRRQFSLRNQGASLDSASKLYYSTGPTTLFNEPIYEGEETIENQSVQDSSTPSWSTAWQDPRAPISTSASTNTVVPQNNTVISVNTNWSSPSMTSSASMGPMSARSKADEWLEDVLRSSLSLSSPPPPDVLSSPRAPPSGPPPSQPPPPLPPVAILNSPSRPVYASENVPPPMTNGMVDVFGQPVFSTPSPVVPPSAPTPPKTEEDPFDVRWSKLALNGANPFSHETAQVNI